MLSIQLAPDKEWWIQANTWDCLYDTAQREGFLPATLSDNWRDIAHANGGFDFADIPEEERGILIAALLQAAKHEHASTKDPKMAEYWAKLFAPFEAK